MNHLTLILASSSVVLSLLLIGLAFYYRSLEQRIKQLKFDMLKQRADQRLLVQADLGISKRISQLQQQQDMLRQRQLQLEQHPDEQSVQRTYQQAHKLLSMGADIEEITASCGLSQSEAELLMSMQGYSAVKKSVAA